MLCSNTGCSITEKTAPAAAYTEPEHHDDARGVDCRAVVTHRMVGVSRHSLRLHLHLQIFLACWPWASCKDSDAVASCCVLAVGFM